MTVNGKEIREAYDLWAEQYDSNKNKTRDLEAISLKQTLGELKVKNCLEIGCGTGKNTEWLIKTADHITAVDFSGEMLSQAKRKIQSEKVRFCQADITGDWLFTDRQYDLITFSLVLEHIENLDDIFQKTSRVLATQGHVYIGELHPFKQYTGTKARFESKNGREELICFDHHVSDFTQSAKRYGFSVVDIHEYFDGDDRGKLPRILMVLLRKA